ncbi:MAG: NAD(P)-dependent oxidoreductase [Candidatus Heimdallarchaeota archaeon]|nr:NAD(P)-dependent oxidoreductase [Candidatus Heimdallarchaeota archaeon]
MDVIKNNSYYNNLEWYPMKILLTGSFGNVGASTLEILLKRKHEVTCFDKKTLENKRIAKKFKKNVKKIIWGDIRNPDKVAKAVEGQDLVLHVAAVIPPKANRNLRYTSQVNTGGTKNIVDAIQKQKKQPKLIYTSSVAIYGDVRKRKSPVITEDYPANPSPGDHYAVTKLDSEEYIKKSGIHWSIFRLSYIPNSEKIKLTPLMFRMPLDTPIEFTHTKDTGLALANAIEKNEVWFNTFNLGGGKKCQFIYEEYLTNMLPLMGISLLPEEAFSDEPFHCCYYDTEKLEEMLKFQQHTFDDLLHEMVKNARSKRILAKLFKPLVKPALLLLSPYYRKNKQKKKKENSQKIKGKHYI